MRSCGLRRSLIAACSPKSSSVPAGAYAWTDAALAVIALELPGWQLRRLEYDGSQWFCALSRGPNLPAMLDDTADANHELMPIAILRAFFQARRMTEIAPRATSPVPQVSDAVESLLRQLRIAGSAFSAPFTLLCRLYEKAPGYVSNSYAPASTLRAVSMTARSGSNEYDIHRYSSAFGNIGE
jgi:hypothetical protein